MSAEGKRDFLKLSKTYVQKQGARIHGNEEIIRRRAIICSLLDENYQLPEGARVGIIQEKLENAGISACCRQTILNDVEVYGICFQFLRASNTERNRILQKAADSSRVYFALKCLEKDKVVFPKPQAQKAPAEPRNPETSDLGTTKQIQNSTDEMHRLLASLSQNTSEIVSAVSNLAQENANQAEATRISLRKELVVHIDENKALLRCTTGLKEQIGVKQQRIDSLEQKLQEADKKVINLERNQLSTTADLQKAQKQIEEYKQRLEIAENRITKVQEAADYNINLMSDTIQNLTAKADKLKRIRHRLVTEVEMSRKELNNALDERDRAIEDQSAALSLCEEKEVELVRCKEALGKIVYQKLVLESFSSSAPSSENNGEDAIEVLLNKSNVYPPKKSFEEIFEEKFPKVMNDGPFFNGYGVICEEKFVNFFASRTMSGGKVDHLDAAARAVSMISKYGRKHGGLQTKRLSEGVWQSRLNGQYRLIWNDDKESRQIRFIDVTSH